MSLTFYYSPHSSAGPVHWTLEELGIPYEKICIDLKSGQQRSPEYLKLNPNGKVPLLVHDGVPIFEAVAIQIYLGETFGVDRGLYPPPGPRRGEALKWLVWTNVTLGDAVSRLWRNTGDYQPPELRNPKVAEQAQAEIVELLGILDQALSGRPYLTGDAFSIADLHLSSWLEYLSQMALDLTAHPAVADWVKRCTARPSHARAD